MASFVRSSCLSICLLFSLVFAHNHQHIDRRASPRKAAPDSSSYPGHNATSSADDSCYYWLEDIKHQGLAPFQGDSSYQVFRDVRDYGAVGDGITDDTDAINLAISTGNRCAPGSCNSTTTTPALVYFPPGTYLISSSVIDYYYTQLIGNPNCLPTLKATSNFTGLGLIDGDPYGANGLSYGATNVFWRQVRNFVLDMSNVVGAATGVHWPTGQATSLQNIVFEMSTASGTQHQGVFIEEGSGGFMNDLVFHGGQYGLNVGNQQFTMRNLTFDGCQTAINQLWDWGWTYSGIHINNCQVGLNMSSGGPNAQTVGSMTFFDSDISNTPVGIITAFNNPNGRYTNGSLIVENVKLNNVPTAIQGVSGTLLAGSTGASTISAWGQGHAYVPNGPQGFQGPIAPNQRPGSLTSGNAYYQKSKPQYEDYPASDFISARSLGARGDGRTDDTSALQAAITAAAARKKILFIDAGDYKVSATLYIPAGTTITGEAYPVILGYGPWFSDIKNPRPIVQIGKKGEQGTVEWTDAIVSTQGATAGAILFEWNLASSGPGSGSYHKRSDDSNWAPQPIGSDQNDGDSDGQDHLGDEHNGHNPYGNHDNNDGSSDDDHQSRSGYPHGIHDTSAYGYPSGQPTWGPYTVNEPSPTNQPYPTNKPYPTGKPYPTEAPYPTGKPQPSGKPRPSPRPKPHPPQMPASGGPSGMWDVHARIGGFQGSKLMLADCPKTPNIATPPAPINENCIAAFMTMHVTSTAANLYMENVWLWVADHDIEDPLLTQITVYAGRGLLVESSAPLWLWGTAVEHHVLYEYQLVKADTIFMGQIQTETAYYQPNPPATIPFPPVPAYSDPNFSAQCYATVGFNFTSQKNFTNNCDGWALRVIDSNEILVYGAGLYSFFANYNTSCSAPSVPPGGPYGCQTSIFSLEGKNDISIYNLNTVGAQSMIDINGQSVASYIDNLNVFPDGIALFRS